MDYTVTFGITPGVEITVWALPDGTIGLSVVEVGEGAAAYLSANECRALARAFIAVADIQEDK